ncbi:hypothetical protein niasHT_013441 [Heterodera trifolii]|uniref:Uncharacterized protein n=1 Tax=Heterodera trifolii TaxID=157864 RepID=A0ABD2LD13_9BILA
MTTAHRPTFDPAKGGTGRNEGDLAKLSQQYSSRDMPSHMTLKYRQKGQAHPEEVVAKNLRRDIEEREQHSRERRSRDSLESFGTGPTSKKQRVEDNSSARNLDADEPFDELDEDDTDLDEDSDNEAELMAELERIRKERAAERASKEAKEREEQERIREENILHGNPLLNPASSEFKVKRRWDDDVVFKNCARGIDERKKTPSFINDAIRSEFHRKFMEKYIK